MALALKPIADQVIVITGASSGIGLVTARAAAAQGATVMLVARNGPALEDIVGAIKAAGGRAAYAIADVGDLAAVRAAADQTISAFGRIDGWVNCAGVSIYAKLVDTPEDEHQRLFQTNYFGVVHGALTALDHLRGRGGALVTVGSIAGDIPSPIMGAYDAAKHAVKGFIESLRIEVIADGLPVAVTLIKPAGMNTPIAEHAANHVDGEALIPPPVYDPALVAEAIIEALQHPQRNVTVGGVGRLQVLLGTHFPGLLARFGGLLSPLLSDPHRPKTEGSNLAAPVDGGREHSDHESGRGVSSYAVARRHPIVLTAVSAVLIGAPLMLRRRRSAKRSPRAKQRRPRR
ncbi:SDR family NAD(P)-dependent oxidoreductase [Sphingomonas koreensis]|nr:SDR family NAD(P)-dependent oxidoreductase [Sphingomonas koreensis]